MLDPDRQRAVHNHLIAHYCKCPACGCQKWGEGQELGLEQSFIGLGSVTVMHAVVVPCEACGFLAMFQAEKVGA